jgi:hypothetical protein
VEKRYLTLVRGHWNLGHTKIDAPLRTDIRVGGERTVKVNSSGKEALSEFRPIQWFGNLATLLEVSLHTGRTHQIRVHAAHAGHPVAGDEKYGDEEFNGAMKDMGLHRMFLHSHSVSFEWPQGAHGGLFSASAPLPQELSAVIDALSGSAARRATRPPRWGSKEASARKPRPRRAESTNDFRAERGGGSREPDLPDAHRSEDGPQRSASQPSARATRPDRNSRDERRQPGGRRAGRQRTSEKARGRGRQHGEKQARGEGRQHAGEKSRGAGRGDQSRAGDRRPTQARRGDGGGRGRGGRQGSR